MTSNQNTAQIGVQLYTLRERTAGDMAGVLRRVAKMGYGGVEFAGFGNLSAGEARAVLDEVGLRAAACHVGAAALEGDFDKAISEVQTVSAPYVVCPWIDPAVSRDEAAWLAFADQLEGWARACAERGLTFAYHNHVFEFESRFGGEYAFDALFQRAPTVQVELDVAWAHVGGVDPAQYLRKYAGRVPLVHLKDLDVSGERPATVELGRGGVDLRGVLRAAREAGARWLIVEQDECQRDEFESVEASLNWLRDARGVSA